MLAGALAPGRFNHARLVKGERPDKGWPDPGVRIVGKRRKKTRKERANPLAFFPSPLFVLRMSFRIALPISECLEQARQRTAPGPPGWELGVGLITPTPYNFLRRNSKLITVGLTKLWMHLQVSV